MSIAAIVVTYNRCKLLFECLEALRNQSYNDFDIIVIDNASTDNTKESLEIHYAQGNRKLLYYNTGANLGGAGGFNYGLKIAYELGFDYFWLMDDDTIPAPKALEELLKVKDILNNNFGYLASKALWIDGTLCKMNIPDFYDKKIDHNKITEKVVIKRATFVSFLISRSVVAKVGLPIKEFFIWADDTNYCLRINKISPGYYVPASIVLHKMKYNTSAVLYNDNSDRLDRYCYAYRNRFYNYKMEHEIIKYLRNMVKMMIKIIFYSDDRKIERIRIMLKGFIQGLIFNPETEYVEREKESTL